MKKLFRTFSAFALIGSLFTFNSCEKVCDEGYEGDKCDVEIRAKYFGTYKVSGTATNDLGSAPITDLIINITTSSAGILNFNISYTLGGDQYSLNAKLDTDGKNFTIPQQTITAGGTNYIYSGSGSFTSNSITLQLTENDNGFVTNVSLTGPKQ